MQTRKLSVKAGYDTLLAESLRVRFVAHRLIRSEPTRLFLFEAPISFFNYGAVIPTAKVEAVVNMALDSHARAARRNPTIGDNPKPARPVVNLVTALTQSSVAVSDGPDDRDFFVVLTSGVRVSFGNCCFTGKGRRQTH